MSTGSNWTEAGTNGFIIVQKGDRVQVVKNPGKKRLKKLKKRGWTLRYKTEQANSTIPDDLRDNLLSTLGSLVEA